MLELESVEGGVIVPVRAHAGARKNGLLGTREGMLRIAVTQAPEKGKANRAIIDVLSGALGVSKSSLELVAGATSSRKRFLVVGGEIESIRGALDKWIAD